MNEHTTFKPDWVSPPGETILDILADRGMSPSQFARGIGETREFTVRLLGGEATITKDIARKLASVLGASESFWMNRESQYRSDLQGLFGESGNTAEWLKSLPVADMVKSGWIKPFPDRATACLRFFGVADVEAWQEGYSNVLVAFRTSPSFASGPGAVTAWIRQGELEAAKIKLRLWNSEAFRKTLAEIRGLTREDDPAAFIPELQRLCAECGVAVVVLRAPNGCRASGATSPLPRNRRLLLLSFRHLSDDQFWFTFFHEAGHLLLHESKAVFIDGEVPFTSREEVEANTFAEEILIPPDRKAEMLALPRDGRRVMRFARDIGISPGIVVGQLQHYGRFQRQQLNNLKKRFQWTDR